MVTSKPPIFPKIDEAKQVKFKAPQIRRPLLADFNIHEFDSQIETYGSYLLWQKSAPCPCQQNSQTDQPRLRCPTCRGSGYRLYAPQIIKGVLSEINPEYDTLDKFGEWAGGRAYCTVRGEYQVGYRDRLTMLGAVMRYSEIIEWNGSSTTKRKLRYPIGLRETTLQHVETGELKIVEGQIDQLTIWRSATSGVEELVQGADYRILPDGTLDFSIGTPRGTAPNKGDQISVSYQMNPPWVVDKLHPSTSSGRGVRVGYLKQSRLLGSEPGAQLIDLPYTFTCGLDFLLTPPEEEE